MAVVRPARLVPARLPAQEPLVPPVARVPLVAQVRPGLLAVRVRVRAQARQEVPQAAAALAAAVAVRNKFAQKNLKAALIGGLTFHGKRARSIRWHGARAPR